jgi:hypothetical protein
MMPAFIHAPRAQPRRKPMPLAQIYVPEGALTLDQKRAMIKGVTDVIAGVENPAGHRPPLRHRPHHRDTERRLGRRRPRLCASGISAADRRQAHHTGGLLIQFGTQAAAHGPAACEKQRQKRQSCHFDQQAAFPPPAQIISCRSKEARTPSRLLAISKLA